MSCRRGGTRCASETLVPLTAWPSFPCLFLACVTDRSHRAPGWPLSKGVWQPIVTTMTPALSFFPSSPVILPPRTLMLRDPFPCGRAGGRAVRVDGLADEEVSGCVNRPLPDALVKKKLGTDDV